jgi:hypothetical protein
MPKAIGKPLGRNQPHSFVQALAQLPVGIDEEKVDSASAPHNSVSQIDDPALRSSAFERLEQDGDAIDLSGHRSDLLFTSAAGSDRFRNRIRPREGEDLLRPLDIWRSAIVRVPAGQLQQSDLTADNLLWLPEADGRFSFRADPFGLWHDSKLHVFVERFDYRLLKGEIEVLIFDHGLNFLGSRIVLQEPWHLSYPFVFEDDGEIFMLPEAGRSGRTVIYRARSFPSEWEPAAEIELAAHAVDSTPFAYDGRWWLLYAVVATDRRTCTLRLAFADRPTGPWRPHPLNPVRVGLSGARPAGTPIRCGGVIDVPVQDGSQTYGGAVRRLRIHRLDETRFEAEDVPWLGPSAALSPFDRGLHTVSAAEEISLIDCKRIQRSIGGTLARRRGKAARRERQASGAEVTR